jgi:hypothetical protein
VTGAASGVTSSSATVSGTVNPEGASVKVSFEFGTTTAYGQSTAGETTTPNNAATVFTSSLTGLPAGTTIHYRAVAASDFGAFVGGDQTLTTTSPLPPPPPSPGSGTASVGHASVSGTRARVRVSCSGPTGATCRLALELTVKEALAGHKLISVTARRKVTKKVVVVGTASATLSAGQSQILGIALNGTGRRLLASRHVLKAKLVVTQVIASGITMTVSTQTITFKAAKKGHRHRTG